MLMRFTMIRGLVLVAAIIVRVPVVTCTARNITLSSSSSSSSSFPPQVPRLRQRSEQRAMEEFPAPSYWPRYSGKRKVWVLDGDGDMWKRSQIREGSYFDSLDPDLDIAKVPTPQPVLEGIPSTIDNAPPGYLGYRGVTFYRRQVTLPADAHKILLSTDIHTHNKPLSKNDTGEVVARLQFQACSFYCRVWLNGVELGDHRAGGYVAFTLDVPANALLLSNSSNGTHELFVLVDNRWNKTTAPLHTGGDFWHYGGILRSVEWHVLPSQTTTSNVARSDSLPEVWPWRVHVFPESNLKEVRLLVQLTDSKYVGRLSGDSSLQVYFDDKTHLKVQVSGLSATTPGQLELGLFEVPTPTIWSPDHPNLHTVSVNLNGAIVTERFGLRYFDSTKPVDVSDELSSFSPPRFRLNGEILKLVGWNHHTQWPDTAASPTDQQLDDDMELLVQGNANYVRGAHYPQDPRWLDRLDEAGMIMWSETLGPDVTVKDLTSPYFLHQQHRQMNQMLDNAMNHPSIAFWAFFNEGESGNPESCPGYQASSDAIRQRDKSRFITYASNVPKDECFAAASVISRNAYPGWYSSKDEDPGEWWRTYANSIVGGDTYNDTWGKPFLISETGAGGIWEWKHNETPGIWTLEYQSKVLASDVRAAIQNENISGISLWHFFDFKVDDPHENNTHCEYLPSVDPPTCGYIQVDTSSPKGRPGGLNHKGVLGFWRRPKPSYYLVSSLFGDSNPP